MYNGNYNSDTNFKSCYLMRSLSEFPYEHKIIIIGNIRRVSVVFEEQLFFNSLLEI